MANLRLSIDLGTSHTVAVVQRDGQPVRALLFDGSPMLPSGIFAGADGSLHTGKDAERSGQVDPERFEPNPKRRIDEGTVLLGDREVTVVDMLAAILRRVASEARMAGVHAAGSTVMTCPADWGRPRRDILRQAARQAGFGEVTMVDEPVAAAAYCVEVVGQRLWTGQALIIFDFGGGTLDVTVVRRDPDRMRVLATGGLDDLGGLDIDAAVIGHLGHLIELRDPALWARLSSPRDAGQARERRAFWAEAKAAKEMLSRTSSAPVQVPGRGDALHLTRDELERVAGPLVQRAVDETRRVLQRAGVGQEQLVGVLLVGGSSRMPMVGSRLHARLGIAPTIPEQPELPVAHGGLLVAAGAVDIGAAPGVGAGGQAGAPGGGGRPTSGAGTQSGPISGPPTSSGPLTAPPWMGQPGTGTPVSTPPWQDSSVSGGMGGLPPVSSPPPPTGPPAPPSWQPGPPGPKGGTTFPVPPPDLRSTKRHAQRSRGRRVGATLVTVFVVVIALLASLGWGVGKVFEKIGDAFDSVASGDLGGLTGGGGLDESGQLKATQDIALTAASAIAADTENGYYAVAKPSSIEVVALPSAGGNPKWTASVPFTAGQLKLSTVNGLVILDASQAKLPNNVNAGRAVVEASSGKLLWHGPYDDHFDLSYIGTDALVEDRDQPTRLVRIDLRTGKEKWKVDGPDDLLIIDSHMAKADRGFPANLDPPKPTDPIPPLEGMFRETLTAGTDVIILDGDNGTGKSVNGVNGQVRKSGPLPFDADMWTVFDGVAIGLVEGASGTEVAGYRVSDLARLWRVPFAGGASIEKIKPCGPSRICILEEPSGGSEPVLHAIDTKKGTQVWTRSADSTVELGWWVLNRQLLVGDDRFSEAYESVVIDVDNKQLRDFSELGTMVYGADRTRMAIGKVNPGAKTTFLVAVVSLDTGKVSPGGDLGASPGKEVAITGNTVVALTHDNHVKVFRLS